MGQKTKTINWPRQGQAIKQVPFIGQVINAENLEEAIDELFYPFIPATISLNSFGLIEKGVEVTPQLIGSITPNDETVFSNEEILVNGAPVDTFTGLNINQPAPASIINNTTYQARVTADNQGSPQVISSPIRTQQFVLPLLYGWSNNANLTGQALYTALRDTGGKVIVNQSTRVLTFNASLQYLYIATPNWADLSRVTDNGGSGDDVTSAWTDNEYTTTVDSQGISPGFINENYKVYRTNITSANNDSFEFQF